MQHTEASVLVHAKSILVYAKLLHLVPNLISQRKTDGLAYNKSIRHFFDL